MTLILRPAGISLAFLLLTFSSFAQTRSGTLVDKTTDKPLPFADVQIHENYGVITNSEGRFSIDISDVSPDDSLHFSSMGYRSKTIALKDYNQGRVPLAPSTEQLGAVYLQNKKLTARQIMDSVKSRRAANYRLTPERFTLFRRNKTTLTPNETQFKFKKARNVVSKNTVKKFNKSLESLSNSTQGVTSTIYSSTLGTSAINQDSLKLKLEKATKLLNKEKNVDTGDFMMEMLNKLSKNLKSDHTFHVRTGIINIGDSVDVSKGFSVDKDTVSQDSLQTKAFKTTLASQIKACVFDNKSDSGVKMEVGPGATAKLPDEFITEIDDYDYHLAGIQQLNNEFVYEIAFKPDHNLFGNKGKYEGKLYISTSDFGILRLRFALAEGEHGQKFNMKWLLGIKYVESAKSGLVIFQKTKKGSYFPKYIRLGGKRYGYLSRNFVLKENGVPRRDRIKIKFKVTFEFNTGYQDEWLITDLTPLSEKGYEQFDENEGVPRQHMKRFNPEVWKPYNTIAPTKAVRDYNEKQ